MAEEVPSEEAHFDFHQDLPYAWLEENGWQKLYEEPYLHVTRSSDLEIPVDAVEIFMGGMATSSDTIQLAAVGPPQALETTARNSPTKYGSVWWYHTPAFSVGFSKNPNLEQRNADAGTVDAEFRLSWHLDGNSGYRLGETTYFNSRENAKESLKLLYYRPMRKVPLQLLPQMDEGTVTVECANLGGDTLKIFHGLDPQETGQNFIQRIRDEVPAPPKAQWSMALPNGEFLDDERLAMPLRELFEMGEEEEEEAQPAPAAIPSTSAG